MNREFVISVRTLAIALGLALLAFLLYQIRDVIIQLVVATILALAMEPAVKFLRRKGMPRPVSVGLVFGLTVFFLGTFLTIALPVVVNQTRTFVSNLPNLVARVANSPELLESLRTSLPQLTIRTSEGVFNTTLSIFSNFFNILTVLVFMLYLSLDLPNLRAKIIGLFSDDLKLNAEDALEAIESSLSRWVTGQLLLMLIVGFASYVGLILLKVPYALPLAILSGLLEIVPILGPIIATVIAGLVGFSITPWMGILVVILFIVIQQLENSILVPRIMQRIIGFNPLVTMIALLVGGKLMGVTGALIAIPMALIMLVIFHTLLNLDLDS